MIPLSYFIEKPFKNWTREKEDLMTTVFVHADYSVPVEQVRQEFYRLLQATEYGTKYDGIGVKVVDRCRDLA